MFEKLLFLLKFNKSQKLSIIIYNELLIDELIQNIVAFTGVFFSGVNYVTRFPYRNAMPNRSSSTSSSYLKDFVELSEIN